MHPGHLTIA